MEAIAALGIALAGLYLLWQLLGLVDGLIDYARSNPRAVGGHPGKEKRASGE